MKRLWLVLLSLGLVLAFSVSAMAVDVKFSGEFYAAGMYLDRTALVKDTGTDGPSTAFYFQRLRVRTDFVVSPGLKLVTRFDAMERIWGGTRSESGSYYPFFGDSANSDYENENIAFDWAYIEYASPIGVFTVGYQPDGGWGTVFADNEVNGLPVGKIGWALTSGGFTGRIQIAKIADFSNRAGLSSPYADVDIDKYSADVKYAWNGGDAGVRGFFWRSAYLRPGEMMTDIYGVIPYVKAKIGPVTIQAELDYYWGDAINWEVPVPMSNIKLQNLGFWVDALADFNMFYVGGTLAYISGDDPGTTDKLEGSIYGILGLTGGVDWNPCLIMFNYDTITKWEGGVNGYDGSQVGGPMYNAWFFQGRAGVRPVPKLDIMASVSYANADKKPTAAWVSNAYGWEVDLTGTYKITNNLSYMLGAGYLFTGDYYKGELDASGLDNKVTNNYILINKLTLTF